MADPTQIGMDLAAYASDRASEAMLQALSLCETPQQAKMVAFKVLGVIAAQAGGVFAGESVQTMSAADTLQMMADLMREEFPAAAEQGGQNGE